MSIVNTIQIKIGVHVESPGESLVRRTVVYYVSELKAKSIDISIPIRNSLSKVCLSTLLLVPFASSAISRLFGIDFVKIGETQVLDARD